MPVTHRSPLACDRVRSFLDTVMYCTIVCCNMCHGGPLSYEVIIPEMGSDPIRVCCHFLDVVSLQQSGVRSIEDVSCDTKSRFWHDGLYEYAGASSFLKVVDVDAVARKLTDEARALIRKGQFRKGQFS